MPPRKHSAPKETPAATCTSRAGAKHTRVSETKKAPPTDAARSPQGLVSLDVNVLNSTITAVLLKAIQTAFSPENLTPLLGRTSTTQTDSVQDSVDDTSLAALVDNAVSRKLTVFPKWNNQWIILPMRKNEEESNENCLKVQGNVAGDRRVSNSSAREPNAGELDFCMRGLLSSALPASSRRMYQRAWDLFHQFYRSPFTLASKLYSSLYFISFVS